jgi:hypothetical protein
MFVFRNLPGSNKVCLAIGLNSVYIYVYMCYGRTLSYFLDLENALTMLLPDPPVNIFNRMR